MEDYLNNLYRRGKYKENSNWLNYNSLNHKRNKSQNNSFCISSNSYNRLYKRSYNDSEGSFNLGHRDSFHRSNSRNFSNGSRNKDSVKGAFNELANRSFQQRRGSKNKEMNFQLYGTPKNY